MSARNVLIASPAAVPVPLTTLLGIATSAVCTRRFGDGGPAVTLTMLGMFRLVSDLAGRLAIFAESALVRCPIGRILGRTR